MKQMKTMNSLRRFRYVLTALFIAHCSLFINVSAQQLSPSARVSLITYGPGQEDISSVFGHTEIRIYDPAIGFDRNYSYGGFDYAADYFVIKFLRGTLPYHISSHTLFQAVNYYQQYNRSIREQVLNMSVPQVQRLYQALETNLLPQNREYSYRFYYDNCSTRPRDMITTAMGDSLIWSPQVKQPTKSYRDWMNDYLGAKPWEQLGMNLAIGRPADKITSGWEAMYLPNNVFDQLTKAQVRSPNGQLTPLVAQTQTIFAGQQLFKSTLPIVVYPDFVFLVLLVLVAFLTWRHWNAGGRTGIWLDRLLFGFAGTWGWFLFLLWFATDHGVTTWNPTLLWLMPLHIPGVFWATSSKRHPFQTNTYFRITALLLVISFFVLNAPGFADTLFVGTLLVRALFRSWVKTERVASRELVRG
ncbi:lipoprotein N-acyltransferase Lnb domain-containing protein [Fibrivirga algicola]|nr:DUF4105 domain-containing protein [Fibrivirga algicola]